MKKRERILASIVGKPVDRVPFGIWMHNFLEENSAEALARQTAALLERFDMDFLKPQSRPYCFAEMWGQEFVPSLSRDAVPTVSKYAIRSAADLPSIKWVRADDGALGEQIESFRLLRGMVGPDVPIIATIWSPLMNIAWMHSSGKDAGMELQRSAPDELERALSNICSTLSDYATACIDAGVDGIYYASTTGNHGQVTDAEFERFQRRFDEKILAAARGGCFNVLHMCGSAINADWFKHYDADVFSWATTSKNPTLTDMFRLTGKTVMSGSPAKPTIAHMEPELLADHIRRSLAEMGGRNHILGPDCSINTSTSDALIEVVRKTVREYRPAL